MPMLHLPHSAPTSVAIAARLAPLCAAWLLAVCGLSAVDPACAAVPAPLPIGDHTTPSTTLDRMPDAFGFGTRTGVDGGQPVDSPVVTPTGYDNATLIPGPDVSYRIDGGPWATTPRTLLNGQTLQIELIASKGSLAYTKGYVTLGGMRGTFTTRNRK